MEVSTAATSSGILPREHGKGVASGIENPGQEGERTAGERRDAVPSEQENDDSKSQRVGLRERKRSEHQALLDLGEDNKVSPEPIPATTA